MQRRHIRQMQLAIVSLALACLALLWIVIAITFWTYVQKQASVIIPTPPQVHDWRPDIRHCHAPEVDLWDCIRNPGDYNPRRS